MTISTRFNLLVVEEEQPKNHLNKITCIYETSHLGPINQRHPGAEQVMHRRIDEPLGQSLDYPAEDDALIAESLAEDWYEDGEHGTDEHRSGEEEFGAVVFCYLSRCYLQTDVAPEEGGEHYVLLVGPFWVSLESA